MRRSHPVAPTLLEDMTTQSRVLCAAVVACCTWCGFDLEAAIGSKGRLRDGRTSTGASSM
jgi:hypothetical protein